MLEFLNSTPAQVVIWVSVLCVLTALGFYLVKRVREERTGGPLSANELLTQFREMEAGGQLDSAEFRKIKSMLGGKLQDEAQTKDADGDG